MEAFADGEGGTGQTKEVVLSLFITPVSSTISHGKDHPQILV